MELPIAIDSERENFRKHLLKRIVRERLRPAKKYHAIAGLSVSQLPSRGCNKRGSGLWIDIQGTSIS
jgi:hypothetical protein